MNFIDQLEHELRAASRRSVRLALARVPRAPAGVAIVVLAFAICAAVAVPLLQARPRVPATRHPGVAGSAKMRRSEPRVVRRVLEGDGIGRATFGEPPATVTRKLEALFGVPPSKPYAPGGACNYDHEIGWRDLGVLFRHGRFVGYSYWPDNWPSKDAARIPTLATTRGLRAGDTLKLGRRFYGSAFHVTAEQGGAWWVRTRHGRIEGYTSEITNPKGKVVSIEAGDVGCAAMAP